MIWFDATRNKMRCYQYLLRAMVKLITSEIGPLVTSPMLDSDENTKWTSQDKQFAHAWKSRFSRQV